MSPAPPHALRIFAALELPPTALRQLAETMAAIKPLVPEGSLRWVRPEGIHLTLVFYGNTQAQLIPSIEAILDRAARTVEPMRLHLGGLGAFPNPKRARVLWIGIQGDLGPVHTLQRAVAQGSQGLGFKPDERGFNPHLTLGRVNQPLRPADQQALVRAMDQARLPAGDAFRLERLSLMRSELKPGGAIYTAMFSAPLGSWND